MCRRRQQSPGGMIEYYIGKGIGKALKRGLKEETTCKFYLDSYQGRRLKQIHGYQLRTVAKV